MSARAVVAAARARELRLCAEATLAWCVALVLVALAIAALVLGGGRWIDAPRWLPLAMTLAFASGAVAVAMHGVRVARAHADAERVAERIERDRGLRAGALVAGMQLDGRSALAAAGISALDAQLARPN